MIIVSWRSYLPVLQFMTYHRVCNQNNTMGATSEAGTAYPSRAPKFTPGFLWGQCYSILRFMCMFCRSLFVLLPFFFCPMCYLFFFYPKLYFDFYIKTRVMVIYVCIMSEVIQQILIATLNYMCIDTNSPVNLRFYLKLIAK